MAISIVCWQLVMDVCWSAVVKRLGTYGQWASAEFMGVFEIAALVGKLIDEVASHDTVA